MWRSAAAQRIGSRSLTIRNFSSATVASWRNSGAQDLPLLAGGVAFFIFLAIAPLITGIVMIYAWLGDEETVGQRISALDRILPSDVTAALNQHLSLAIEHSHETGAIALVFALGFAIYCGLFAVKGFVSALNLINRIDETRTFWILTSRRLSITAIGVLLGVLALMAGAGLTYLLTRSPMAAAQSVNAIIDLLFWVMLIVIGGAGFIMILRLCPNRTPRAWRFTMSGAAFAMVMSLATSFAFSSYVAYIYDYSATYGSASALVVFLLWIYLSCFSLLLGASINFELETRNATDESTST